MTNTTPTAPAGPPAGASHAEKLPSLWGNRDFLFLWSGRTVSHVGSAASGVVFPLLILSITGDNALLAGIAVALGTLPYVLLSLHAGALVDRWDRKRVLIWSMALRAANIASVVVTLSAGSITLWQLYLNALIEGTLVVFTGIAATAALPRVVPKLQLPDANSQSLAADTLAQMSGPALGTWLYQAVSRAAPFLLEVVSYLMSAVLMLFIRRSLQGERVPTQSSLRQEIARGWIWWWTQPFLRSMAYINSGLHLVLPALTLLIIVRAKDVGVPDGSVGLLFTAGALGGLAGALVGPRLQRRLSYGRAVPGIILYQALTFPLLAVAPAPVVLGLAFFLVEAAPPAYDVVQYSYRLALIPDELQGRVNSSFRLLAWGTRPVGALLAGFLLEWVGGMVTALLYAALLLSLSLAAFANRHIRNAPPLAEVARQS
ncbi:MAG TPA: MFS transporter [Chloroflexia bacterium]|nr:MFS transporter [Chloroflexia bacterium]